MDNAKTIIIDEIDSDVFENMEDFTSLRVSGSKVVVDNLTSLVRELMPRLQDAQMEIEVKKTIVGKAKEAGLDGEGMRAIHAVTNLAIVEKIDACLELTDSWGASSVAALIEEYKVAKTSSGKPVSKAIENLRRDIRKDLGKRENAVSGTHREMVEAAGFMELACIHLGEMFNVFCEQMGKNPDNATIAFLSFITIKESMERIFEAERGMRDEPGDRKHRKAYEAYKNGEAVCGVRFVRQIFARGAFERHMVH